MCPKVMNFVEIKKIQLNKVVENIKLNPLNKKTGFALEMENPHR
jgi:hypothetical protein